VQRLVLILLVACAIATVAGTARSSTSVGSQPAARMPALSQRGSDAIAGIHWTEQVYTASTSEPVDVSVSSSYPADQPVGQRWADFFASLLHGPELARLKVYVAPLGEVQQICGGGAVGCYGDDRLIVTNEPARGFAPEEVARHEYGHHIARNRSNAPWSASDWGPKRWASSANICRRVRWNTAYPGDESLLYKLNPAEAFAEAYRVLVDTRLGNARPSWPLVDASFYPDQAGLAAVEQDVVAPWIGPTTRVFSVRIPRGPRPVWTRKISTPLDGTLRIAPPPLPGALVLLGDDGRPLRATDSWSQESLRYEICGQRSLTIRLTAPGGGVRSFDLRVTVP
jgi:hypothetical protein